MQQLSLSLLMRSTDKYRCILSGAYTKCLKYFGLWLVIVPSLRYKQLLRFLACHAADGPPRTDHRAVSGPLPINTGPWSPTLPYRPLRLSMHLYYHDKFGPPLFVPPGPYILKYLDPPALIFLDPHACYQL